MKTVRLVGQGIPARLTDADARQLVEVDKDGEYCSKSVFKQFIATCPDENYKNSLIAGARAAGDKATRISRANDEKQRKPKAR